MGEMRESFDALKADCKQRHDARVAKTPQRVEYAMQQLVMNNIDFRLLNAQTGHFHCHGIKSDKLYQFWAGTGKIMGSELRGIHNLIKLVKNN